MISTSTMSNPPLPQTVWLQVFGELRYLDLKVVQLYNRSFRELVAQRSLDAVMYRQGPDPAKTRQAMGLDDPYYDPAEAYEFFSFKLHTLLDAEDAWRQFPHAAWFASTSYERVAIVGGKPPALLAANPAQYEMATVPAVTRLLVRLSWDSVTPEPDLVVNPAGVTVGDVVRSLCDLCEVSIDEDEDDSVARSLDALGSWNGDVEWETDLGVGPGGVVQLEVEIADMPWSWPAERIDDLRQSSGWIPDPEVAARYTEIVLMMMGEQAARGPPAPWPML